MLGWPTVIPSPIAEHWQLAYRIIPPDSLTLYNLEPPLTGSQLAIADHSRATSQSNDGHIKQ